MTHKLKEEIRFESGEELEVEVRKEKENETRAQREEGEKKGYESLKP